MLVRLTQIPLNESFLPFSQKINIWTVLYNACCNFLIIFIKSISVKIFTEVKNI